MITAGKKHRRDATYDGTRHGVGRINPGLKPPFIGLECLKYYFDNSLGGGNSNIYGIFTPNLGEMIQFDYVIYFSKGLKPPTSYLFYFSQVLFFY